MEMEEMPDFEELQWLENSAILQNSPMDHEDDHREGEAEPLPELPESSDLHAVKIPSKRTRSPDKSVPPEVEEDEEWLRYSPPQKRAAPGKDKGNAASVTVEMVRDGGESTFVDCFPSVVEEASFPRRFLSEVEGDFLPVTGPDGSRVYVGLRGAENNNKKKLADSRATGRQGKFLLKEPISSLLDKIEREAVLKACNDSLETGNESTSQTESSNDERLWVDKYAPKHFTELLSDEKTNREVLGWLKQWDSRVFGSQKRATADDVLSDLRHHTSLSQSHKPLGHRKRYLFKKDGLEEWNHSNPRLSSSDETVNMLKKQQADNDQLCEKVLLLCGPPGLGKTTLAHVAAKHCGYRVIEINASDDRSASAIESKILDVVQMNSVTADSRPKCLVIDEIDGSLSEGKGAIDVILKMLSVEKKSAGALKVTQEPNSGKSAPVKEAKRKGLSRPVICICNDLFAPALRPLRQVAKVHKFVLPTTSRVVSRLKHICKQEGFNTSSLGLAVLAEYTECDIRSCLNTLQFLCKKKEALNVLNVSSQVVGRKDMSKSTFDVWKEIFQKRKRKRERVDPNGSAIVPSDFDRLHDLIFQGGEYELTMEGIHENFLNLHYHDPVMDKTSKCFQMLEASDSLLTRSIRNQQMPLLAYQPSIAIAMRNLICQIDQPTIEWPKAFQRHRVALMEKKELLKLWFSKISPEISRHISIYSFVEDAVTPLLYILAPPTIRPVAVNLSSEREKDELRQLVDTMISYSVNYKESESESSDLHKTNRSSLFLDPPIFEFVKFKDYHCRPPALPLPVQHVLIHEVAKEKIFKESTSKFSTLNGDKNHCMTAAEISASLVNAKILSAQRVPDTEVIGNKYTSSCKRSVPETKTKPAPATKKPTACSNFFARFIKSNGKGSAGDSSPQLLATSERDSRPLLFKFNEGFTNAVKRPVRVRELLL